MTADYTYAKGSAAPSQHKAIEALGFYHDILPLVPTAPGSVILDFGTGIGRDALAFYDRSGGQAIVIAVDPDPAMKAASKTEYPGRFLYAGEQDGPADPQDRRPLYIEDSLPKLDALRGALPDLKADFALCNAVLMFVRPEDRETSLAAMAERLGPKGSLVLRFRTVDLKPGMHPITQAGIDRAVNAVATDYNLTARKTKPAADPLGRFAPNGKPYFWHQRILTRKAG